MRSFGGRIQFTDASFADIHMSEHPARRAAHRIPALDGIRAMAISLVILSHLRFGNEHIPASAAVGNLGVRLFFVLSGFLITHLLVSEERATGRVGLRQFYVRRAFRILPACWVYMLAMGVLTAAHFVTTSGLTFWASLFYFSNYVRWDLIDEPLRHLWSLSVEEQFYLLWPFAFVIWPRWRVPILSAVMILSPVWRLMVLGHPQWHMLETIDRRFDCIGDCIGAGCLLALIRDAPPVHRLLKSGMALAIAGAGLLGVFADPFPRVYYGIGQTAVNLSLAAWIDGSVRFHKSRFLRWLDWKLVAVVGVMSYSLYLWQQIFLSERFGSAGNIMLQVSLSFAAAAGSFYLVERPMLRLRARLAEKRTSRADALSTCTTKS